MPCALVHATILKDSYHSEKKKHNERYNCMKQGSLNIEAGKMEIIL